MMHKWSGWAGRGLTRVLFLTALLVGLVSVQAFAGLKLSFRDGGGGTSAILVQDGRFAQSDDASGFMLDCSTGELTAWDTGKQVYWQGDVDEMIAGMQAMMADLQKSLAKYQAMMPKSNNAKPSAKPLGSRTFAGYKAVGYAISGSGPMAAMQSTEAWYSSDLQKQVNKETGRCDAFASIASASVMGDAGSLMTDLARKHGYIVSQSMVMMGRRQPITELQKVQSFNAPASAFTVPNGLERVESYQAFLKEISQ